MSGLPEAAAGLIRRRPYDLSTRRPWHRSVRPTRGGVLCLGLAVLLYAAGANVGAGWTVVLSAVLAGAVLRGLVVVWRAGSRLQIARELPAHASTVRATVATVRVAAPDGLVLVVLDELTRAAGALAGADRTMRSAARLDRGTHDEGRVLVHVRDRLGLVCAVVAAEVEGHVLVLPDAPAGGGGAAPPGDGDEESQQRRGVSIDVLGLREYRPGDASRSVSWRATARRGTLVVTESSRPSRPALRIALEGGQWERDALDAACEQVVAAARAASAAGRPVELAVDGAVHPWSDASGDERARTVLALLPPHVGAEARPLAPPPSAAGETTTISRASVRTTGERSAA